MPSELELVKEKITLNSKAGEDNSQLLLEGDVIVPDVKPDIESILRVSGDVVLEDVRADDERLSFKGSLNASILYQAKKSDKLIHSMTAAIPIEDFINMEGVTKASRAEITPQLEHLEYSLINDRKISIKAVVAMQAEAENELPCEIVKDIEQGPDIQTKKGSMTVSNTVENKKDRFTVKEELPLSGGKPNIRELLESDVRISGKEVKAMEGKVWVKGNLCISTLYIGDNDESIIEVMEHEVPFNGYIEAKDTQADMMPRVKLSVLDQEIRVVPDGDGEDRVLEAEITIGADMKVSDNEEIYMVEDAYCIDKPLNIQKEKIEYPQFIGRNAAEASLRQNMVLPEKAPDMMQVEKVWGAVNLDGTEIMQDKVIAEGACSLSTLYIAKDDYNPVGVASVTIPFQQEIEIRGAEPGMNAEITADIEDISFNMLSEREAEMRVVVVFDVYMTKQAAGEVITEMEYCTECGPLRPTASVIIYVVQKGDTLWNIAKKYNTTVADLTLLNEIENPDRIYPGQKLLILKKLAGQ